MKYKIIVLTVMVLLIVITVVFSSFEFKNKRYHQHIEADVRAEDVVTKDEFATHLPIIKIEIDEDIPEPFIMNEDGTIRKDENGNEMKNDDTISAKVEYIQNDGKENKISDTPEFKSNAKFRVRGNSSRTFDKKGYLIKFMNDDYTQSRDIEIDGMVADSDWVLHGPYMDKTLIRNYISYNIAGEIMDYSPNVRFCEMFINGEYEGLYLLTEEIKYNEEGRVNITEAGKNSKDTSYLIKMDRGTEDENRKVDNFLYVSGKSHKATSGKMEILYPASNLTEEQHDYIEDDILTIERILVSHQLDDKRNGYRKYIDEKSFIDYFIINVFSTNGDATNLSTFFYKDIRGKIKMVVWDFNNAYDNYYLSDDTKRLIFQDSWWYKYLIKDKKFTENLIKEYEKLRRGILSDEYLLSYIDETIEYLGPAIDRNYQRWPQSLYYDKLKPKSRNQHSYEDAIKYLKNAIVKRGKYLDDNIYNLRYYSHESINKKQLGGDK